MGVENNIENKTCARSYLPSPKRMEEIKREASEYTDEVIGHLPEMSIFTLIAIFVEGCLTGKSKTMERLDRENEEYIKRSRSFPQQIKK